MDYSNIPEKKTKLSLGEFEPPTFQLATKCANQVHHRDNCAALVCL